MVFITSAPVVVTVIEGENAISVVRNLLGATSGYEAKPGTVRGDYALSNRFNLVHGSDSAESAAREMSIFFSADELTEYDKFGDEYMQY